MKRVYVVMVGVLLVAAACTSSSDDTTTTVTVAETTTTAAVTETTTTVTVAETTTTAATTTTTTTASVPAGSGSVWLAVGAQQQLGLTIEESVGIPPAVVPILESVDVGTFGPANPVDIDVAVITPAGMYLPEAGVYTPESDNENENENENGCMIADASVVVRTDDVEVNRLEPMPAGESQFGSPDGELNYEAPVEVADVSLVQVPAGQDALGYVVELLAAGIPAWPHYAVNLGARWKYGPATVPTPVPSGASLPNLTTSRKGSNVTVIDAFGVTAPDVAAGHGEFIVGILRRLGVPASEVNAQFYGSPISSEMEIANLIVDGINNVALGTNACVVQEGSEFPDGSEVPDLNEDGDTEDILTLPPIVLARAIIEKSSFVVAAAGNDSEAGEPCLPPWVPAAYADFDLYFPQDSLPVAIADQYTGVAEKVVGVGASGNPDIGNRASFSNCGCSTIFAPGIGIISDHPEMAEGLAVWSGSSFAAPIIAGLSARGEVSP